MIWGTMSCRGAAGLYFILLDTTLNGMWYVELLIEKLKLHMRNNGCMIFVQDGGPCHSSKVVTEFLKKNKISVLEWPGNSSDLNLMKNLWTMMKDKVAYKQLSSDENLRQPSRKFGSLISPRSAANLWYPSSHWQQRRTY